MKTLTIKGILLVLLTGRLWLQQLTFNHPLQPQRIQVEKPELLRVRTSHSGEKLEMEKAKAEGKTT